MRYLPELQVGRRAVRLPLASFTEARLAAALLADSVEDRARRLEQAIADDPGLALWAVLRFAASQRPGAPDERCAETIESVAAVLAAADLHGQDWAQPPEDLLRAAGSAMDEEAWAELAAESWAVACSAAEPEQQRGPDLASRARLCGLVHLAPRWLALAGAGEEAGALPTWISCAHGADQSVACGAAMACRCSPRAQSPAGEPAITSDDRHVATTEHEAAERQMHWDRCKADYRRRWQGASEGPPGLLELVCTKLRRLDELENHFDRALREAKLGALREFAYGAGHEINNPLANISTRAQTLLAEERDPERRRKLAAIHLQAMRAHEMLADLMLFARPPRLEPQPVDIVSLVAELAEQFAEAARTQQTELVLEVTCTQRMLEADPVHLRVAIGALARNALEAVGQGGRVAIAVRPAVAGWVAVAVSDNGPGLAEQDLQRIFDPFYSGREAGRGLGFGLPKCWRIVTEHGGRLDVTSEPGRGATFTIWLPERREQPEEP